MDRDTAVAKLRSGPEGVSEWNHFRSGQEQMPDLSGVDLSEVDLSGVNLSSMKLIGTDFAGSTMFAAVLVGASLERAIMNSTRLEHSDLTGADLTGAELNGAELNSATLYRAVLNRAQLVRAEMNRAEMSNAILNGAKLNGAKLRGAKLPWAELNDSDLSGAKLTAADLSRTELNNAKLRFADLTNATLNGAKLNGADLGQAVLVGVSAIRVELARAELCEAELNGADLNGAMLQGADLRDAKLVNTKLANAKLFRTNLRGADARGATFEKCALSPQKFPSLLAWVVFALKKLLRKLSWESVRAVGTLEVLTRASYVMLGLVPILAAVWQGVRVWTGHAKLETSQEVQRLDEKLQKFGDSKTVQRVDALWEWMEHQKAAGVPVGGPAIPPEDYGEIKEEFERVRGQLARVKVVVDGLNPRLPTPWVWGYLAALFVAAGHLTYQVFAPELVKAQSPDGHAKAQVAAFSEHEPGYRDQLTRAIYHLDQLARRHPDWWNANLVERHGEVRWIPDRLYQFADAIVPNVSEPEEAAGASNTVIPADPALMSIAIEEGARAEYQNQALTVRPWAGVAMTCYISAAIFIVVIVVTQTVSVFQAAFG